MEEAIFTFKDGIYIGSLLFALGAGWYGMKIQMVKFAGKFKRQDEINIELKDALKSTKETIWSKLNNIESEAKETLITVTRIETLLGNKK